MENKEIEKSLNNIYEGVFCDEDTDSIKEYIEQLEEENKDLRERLIRSNRFGRKSNEIRQEVERKLDKYAILLSREVKVATWEHPGGIYMSPNYWKARCENESKEKSHLFFTDNQVKIIEQLKQEDEDLSDYIRDLEKALDKSCEELEQWDKTYSEILDYDGIKTKEQWKEWCMNK